MGLVFEQMCREYLLRYAEDLPIILSDVGQWWGTDAKEKKEVQIDIVGTPVEGKEYIIGSCKYRNETIGVDELELLKHYATVFGKGQKYHYYIFSKGGFHEVKFRILKILLAGISTEKAKQQRIIYIPLVSFMLLCRKYRNYNVFTRFLKSIEFIRETRTVALPGKAAINVRSASGVMPTTLDRFTIADLETR